MLLKNYVNSGILVRLADSNFDGTVDLAEVAQNCRATSAEGVWKTRGYAKLGYQQGGCLAQFHDWSQQQSKYDCPDQHTTERTIGSSVRIAACFDLRDEAEQRSGRVL